MSDFIIKAIGYDPNEFLTTLIGVIAIVLVEITGVSILIGFIYLMDKLEEKKNENDSMPSM